MMRRGLTLTASVVLACSSPTAAPPTTTANAPAPSASPSAASSAPSPSSPSAASSASPAAPVASAAATAEPAPKPATKPPKIVTIGMHVAGGPFDEATKEPFKRAVEPHFPAIAQCWSAEVPDPPKTADVGVDLLIDASGGKPKVSNPRSTLPLVTTCMATKCPKASEIPGGNNGFVPCVVHVFEGVEFPKLDRGRTGVSYSVRITAIP